MPQPKAIIFDWDHTLVNTWPAITQALNAARGAFGLSLWSVEEARNTATRSMRDSFPEWFGDNWERARDIFYAKYHDVHAELLQPMPGAARLLDGLCKKNIPLLIVSTKRGDLLRAEIAAMGWGGYFRAVAGAGDAEKDKPNRAPVDMVLTQIGMKADDVDVWFVGDSEADTNCALNSGCTPVVIGNPELADRLGLARSFSDCNTLAFALL